MRVLFLDQFSEMGGAQHCLADLIPGLQALGWDLHVALPSEGPLADRLREQQVPVTLLPLASYTSGHKRVSDVVRFALGHSKLRAAIEETARKVRPDVVYVNGPRLLPAVDVEIPVVFHAHNYLSKSYAVHLVGRAIERYKMHVIASSQFVSEPLREFAEAGRLRVIYNGTADVQFRDRSGPAMTVALIGRIAPEKGQLEFVRAARLLRTAGMRFRIQGAPLFAEQRYFDQVRAEAPEDVEFSGWSDSIADVLYQSDLLAVPSPHYESTPRVILEAFSAGTPVIAFATGGIPELIRSGETGVLTAERTPEALASAIEASIRDPAGLQRIAIAARQQWEREYTLCRFQTEVAEVIAEAALRPNRTRKSSAASRTNPAAASNTGP